MSRTIRWRLPMLLVLMAVSATGIWECLKWRDSELESFRQQQANRAIWQRLDQPVTLHYPDGIQLATLFNQLKPLGLDVCIDAEGLQHLYSIVKIDAQSIKAKDALESVLKPLGLKFFVKDGMLGVTGENVKID